MFSFRERETYVLLTKKEDLKTNDFGLPGELIAPDKDTDEAVNELMMRTIGTDQTYKKQLHAFSGVNRHPQGRVISFAYYGLVRQEDIDPEINANLEWQKLKDVPNLALDHSEILNKIIKGFRQGLLRHPIVFELLPEQFKLSEIINAYSSVFDKKLDGSNFRKQLVKSKVLVPLNIKKKEPGMNGRPSELYRFDRAAYTVTKDQIGFHF